MSSTMLQLIQQATSEMGVTVPSSVAGNTSTDVVQLLALLNAVGYEVQREHQWEAMTVEYRFSTVYYQYTADTTNGSASISSMSSTTGLTDDPTYFTVTGTGVPQDTYLSSVNSGASTAVLSQEMQATGTGVTLTFSQTKYELPSGFDRLIDRTDWDKSQHWEMLGPETAQQWQWLKSGFISTGPRVRFRVLGGLFQIWPALAAEHLLGFEYVSNLWVTASGQATPNKTSFTVDTDTCIFPDRLMVLGLKKKYYEAKGFDTTALQRDYRMQLDISKANDAGSPTLSFAPRPGSVLLTWDNIPDSNYGT